MGTTALTPDIDFFVSIGYLAIDLECVADTPGGYYVIYLSTTCLYISRKIFYVN